MQSTWDFIQQQIRIILYAAAGGWVVTAAWSDTLRDAVIGLILFGLTQAWTYYWNKKKVVTVSGLEDAGHPAAAAAVENAKAIEAAKK